MSEKTIDGALVRFLVQHWRNRALQIKKETQRGTMAHHLAAYAEATVWERAAIELEMLEAFEREGLEAALKAADASGSTYSPADE
jgi:hypothetical protein